jgi:8-oxo-dGTP diphosphatase
LPLRHQAKIQALAMNQDPATPARRRGAVAVIVRDGRLLVIRRAVGVVAPGAYCFPGGGIEAGETEPQALVREIEEELGVSVRPLRRLWQSVTAWQVELFWWLAELPDEARLVPNPAEVESTHWVPAAELSAWPGLLASNDDFLRALAAGEFTLARRPDDSAG